MKTGSITYNGKNSLTDLGIYVTGSGSFDAAELDVDRYEVAGRNGDIIIPKNRYKNISISYPAFIPKGFEGKVQSVRNWLRSAKTYARLEDTYDMNHYRLGLASGIQSFEPANRNDASNFALTFDCKPQRFLKTGETESKVEVDSHSYTGDLVSFDTIAEDDLTTLKSSIVPVQSGSGDPSPNNIRPITGHDSATLYRTGKNLIPNKTHQDSSSRLWLGTDSSTPYYLFLKAGTYTLSASLEISARFILREYSDTANTDVGSASTTPSGSFTLTKDGNYSIWLYKSGITAADVNWFQLELGSQPTAYVDYVGSSYPVSFGQTVYGGTFDWVSGKLVATWAMIASYNGEALPARWISDRDVYAAGTTPTMGAQVCYELATPIEIDLTPAQVQTLLGLNNVWSDCGQVTVGYADPFSITNPTEEEARPLFRLVNPQQNDVITLNGKTITISTSYTGEMFIDCETMDAFSSSGTNLNSYITATDFPVLKEGLNIVTFTGSGDIFITPRWWEL